jgi:hypothetical protein
VTGISASTSMSLDIEGGIDSAGGATGTEAAGCGAGNEAARASAIVEVAMFLSERWRPEKMEVGVCPCLYHTMSASRPLALAARSPRLVVARSSTPCASFTARHGHHDAPQYNEPSGYLWGEKASDLLTDSQLRLNILQPLANGQKRQREDWETIWNVGFFGSLLVGGVLLYLKPDTR